jgi:hypothetical protein
MKIRPEPASVEDASDAGNPVLHSKRSASRVRKGSLSNQSHQQNIMYGRSACKGPVREGIATYSGLFSPLTIFSSSLDRTAERNEVPGHRFRKIFFRGTL